MSKLYEASDLKTMIEALAIEARQLKQDVKELEGERRESAELVAENAALRKDTARLQTQFVRSLAAGARVSELRHVARITEVLRHDVERMRLPVKPAV